MQAITAPILSKVALFPDRRPYCEPREAFLEAEAIDVRSPRGTVLKGWRIPSSSNVCSAPTVVFLPGNSGNLSSHLLYLELLHRAGCNVLALDYTGFGKSERRPDLRTLLEDAHVACDAALEWRSEVGQPKRKIGTFGLSIGANLALMVAATRHDIGAIAVEGLSIQREFIRGITLDGFAGPSTVSSVSVDGQALPRRDQFRFPGIRGPRPVAAVVSLLAEACYPFHGKDPVKQVKRLKETPLLIVHGTSDRLFPFEAAVELGRAHGGARMWLIPGIGHAQEPALAVDNEYAAQLEDLFHRWLGWDDASSRAIQPEIDVEATNGSVGVHVPAGATGGAFLLTLIGERALQFHRIWLESNDTFTTRHPEDFNHASVVRIHCAERDGVGWKEQVSQRADLFNSTYGPVLRDLSATLHAREIQPALKHLNDLARLSPPFPFNLMGRLHSSRLERLAAKKHPEIAQQARQLFARFADP